jgi:hypothetical protein
LSWLYFNHWSCYRILTRGISNTEDQITCKYDILHEIRTRNITLHNSKSDANNRGHDNNKVYHLFPLPEQVKRQWGSWDKFPNVSHSQKYKWQHTKIIKQVYLKYG